MFKVLVRKEDRRVIGNIDEKRNLFLKKVDKSKHLFRKTNAWAIDEMLFSKKLYPDKAFIVIYDREGKDYYKITAEKFKEKSILLQFGNMGLQRFCPIIEFDVSKNL